VRLENQIAIVTGAAFGIGKGIARGFAREGANVVIADIDFEAAAVATGELDEFGRRAIAVRADVADEASVDKLVDSVLGTFGRIDILVNNAAVTSFYPFLELPVAEWDRIISVNLRGAFLCSRKVAPHMAKQRHGSILNITSFDQDIPRGSSAHYAASKGGLRSLTKAMAIGLAPYNIRVNAIVPGTTDTEISKKLHLRDTPEKVAAYLDRIPLNRIGKPEDFAGAAIYLVSEEASFVTGAVLAVDGGMTTLGLQKG
jgi:NAD(P)-dependent dehydrogenase (short-subunit alcohol dehydrogenase family)